MLVNLLNWVAHLIWTFYSITESDAGVDLFFMHKVDNKRIRYTTRLFTKRMHRQLKRNHNACVTEYKEVVFPDVKYLHCISAENREIELSYLQFSHINNETVKLNGIHLKQSAHSATLTPLQQHTRSILTLY